jgi:hypothetical protein
MKWVQGVTNPHVIQDLNGLWVATCAKPEVAEQIVNFNNNFLEEAMRPSGITTNQIEEEFERTFNSGWGRRFN